MLLKVSWCYCFLSRGDETCRGVAWRGGGCHLRLLTLAEDMIQTFLCVRGRHHDEKDDEDDAGSMEEEEEGEEDDDCFF